MKKKLFLDTLYVMLNSPDLELWLFSLFLSWLTIKSIIVKVIYARPWGPREAFGDLLKSNKHCKVQPG